MKVEEISEDSDLYQEAISLRFVVFFQPYGLSREVTADEMESFSKHFVVKDGIRLAAYARLTEIDSAIFRISQVVVDEAYRGRRIANLLIEQLIEEARSLGSKQIRLGAQTSAQNLYESLGFKPVSDPYTVELTGVEHVKMALDTPPK